MRWLRRLFRPLARRVRSRARRFVLDAVGTPERRDGRRLDRLVEAGHVEIGRHTYGVPRIATYIGDSSRVVIGSFCSIAEDVEIFTGGNHRPDWVSTFPFRSRFGLPGAFDDGHPASKGDVVIGHDVWVGRGASILSGVTIGDGAVVGAYAVVTKDVRPYAVVAGNPAREIRRRFDDDTIERLITLRWWDWPDERILASVPLLNSDRMDEFLKASEDSSGG